MKKYSINRVRINIFFSVILIVLTSVLLPLNSVAQKLDPKFQSVFVYGVARKIEWSNNSSVFKIGILGNDKAFFSELNKLAASKTLNDKSVQVKQLGTSTANLNYDIIFVAGDDKDLLSKVLTNVGGSTLVMSAYPKGGEDGAYINFVLVGNKITFELNKTAISKTSLKVTDGLIGLAAVVK